MNRRNIGSKFEEINRAETFAQLSQAILNIADRDGNIQGRNILFSAKELSQQCLELRDDEHKNWNLLTREYGIRQQAIYLDYYNCP